MFPCSPSPSAPRRHDTFLTAMVRRKRRATQDASEKNPTNARSHKSSDTNEAITTPLSTPVKNQATVAQTADYTGLQQREGDIVGIVEPTDDVSNLSVLVSGASLGDDVGSDTGVPSRTRQDLGGGIGTVVVGFSPGTAYLEAFLKRVFTKVFYWVDKVIRIFEVYVCTYGCIRDYIDCESREEGNDARCFSGHECMYVVVEILGGYTLPVILQTSWYNILEIDVYTGQQIARHHGITERFSRRSGNYDRS